MKLTFLKKHFIFLRFIGLVTTCFLSLSFSVHADDRISIEIIRSELNNLKSADLKTPEFQKAWHFFTNRDFDSSSFHAYAYLNRKGRDRQLDGYCYYFRGVTLMKKKLFAKAKNSFQKIPKNNALNLLVELNLGEIDLEMDNYQAAIDHFFRAEPQMKEKHLEMGILYHNIGVAYLHIEQLKESEHYLVKAMKIQERNQDTLLLISTYLDLANLYYNQYMDDLAIPYFEKAYIYSTQTNDFDIRQQAAFNMSIVEENRDDLVKALEYRKIYEQWNDSLTDQNKVWELANLEKGLISKQAKTDIELLESKNREQTAQRRLLIIGSITLLAVAVALFLL